MPGNPAAYEPVLSGKALSVLTGLSRSKQRRMIEMLSRLAEHPGQLGDYTTCDPNGRELQYLRLGEWRVSFWADHAVQELRVVGITKL